MPRCGPLAPTRCRTGGAPAPLAQSSEKWARNPWSRGGGAPGRRGTELGVARSSGVAESGVALRYNILRRFVHRQNATDGVLRPSDGSSVRRTEGGRKFRPAQFRPADGGLRPPDGIERDGTSVPPPSAGRSFRPTGGVLRPSRFAGGRNDGEYYSAALLRTPPLRYSAPLQAPFPGGPEPPPPDSTDSGPIFHCSEPEGRGPRQSGTSLERADHNAAYGAWVRARARGGPRRVAVLHAKVAACIYNIIA